MAGQEATYNDQQDYPAPEADAPATDQPAAAKLLSLLSSQNLAATLDEEKLAEIAAKCIRGYRIDDASRDDWKQINEQGLKLASLVAEKKEYPFSGASNVKTPLIIVGALQFNARAYPAIIQGDRVAKCKVNGHDPDGQKAKRADRVSEHMSWQLTTEMPEWEEDTDRLLLLAALSGAVFRKRYWDPSLRRQCSRLITADRLVINYRSRSLEDTPRISEELPLYPYEIEERIRAKRFIEFEYGQATPDPDDKEAQDVSDDEDAPHKFIEQHCLIDLDGDDYPEPYIVTIHLEKEKVCRIVPNFDKDSVTVTQDGKVAAIRKRDYYTKYTFFPSADGGAYGMGFGSLMGSTTEAVNTTINEMLDAGHLSNLQGGFISAAAGIREKSIVLKRGEFKVINTAVPMNQAVMQMKFDGPSPVLFQLLGLLMEFGKDISGTKDVLTGDTGGKVMQPTTVLALIEQGMKVFNAIFKRIHRAVKHELEMHARLNFENLTPEAYNAFFDGPEQYDPKADYDLKSMDITPISDPSVATQMQKLAKSQIIAEIAANNPAINQVEATRRRLEAAEIEDIDKLVIQQPAPDPKEVAFADAMKQMTLLKEKATIGKLETAQYLDVANAEAVEATAGLDAHDLLLRTITAEHGMEMDLNGQQATPGATDAQGQPLSGVLATRMNAPATVKQPDPQIAALKASIDQTSLQLNSKITELQAALQQEKDRTGIEQQKLDREYDFKNRELDQKKQLELAKIEATEETSTGPDGTSIKTVKSRADINNQKLMDGLVQLSSMVEQLHKTAAAPTVIERGADGRVTGARKVIN